MGHYDEQYEKWDDEVREQNLKTTKAELKKAVDKLLEKENIGDMRFVINVIDDIKDLKTFFKVLKKI